MGARTDSELVRAALAGEAAAFGRLYDRHSGRVRALARGIVGGGEADDVAQDAMLAAFVDLARLRDPNRFGGWLYAIAVNLARMRVRAQRSDLAAAPAAAPVANDDALVVRDAVRSLPGAEREVVFLHYFDGLTCSEIGLRDGSTAGAVRVRLHRARARLRIELADLRPREVPAMTEVLIEDVLVRCGEGATHEDTPLRVVLLRERDGERVLAIWVGAAEGDSLAVGIGGDELPRPLTSDLTTRLLDAAGARIERVTVNRLEEKTFYAVVAVTGGRGTSEIDARPSDALNLAVRTGAAVFVSDDVLERAGLPGDDLGRELDEIELALAPELDPAGEWRRLSGEEVTAAWLARVPK